MNGVFYSLQTAITQSAPFQRAYDLGDPTATATVFALVGVKDEENQ